MTTLRIFLMGLVALVPGHDAQGRRTVTVLLLEARSEHHQHYPIIAYDPRQRICAPQEPNCPDGESIDIARALKRNSPSPGLFLNGVEVNIVGAESGGVGTIEETYQKRWYHGWVGVVPRTRAAANDFSWVPKMKDVVPGSDVVRRELLGSNPPGLAARLTLGGGMLSTFGLADLRGFIRSMTFKKEGSLGPLRGKKQALGDTVVVVLNVRGDEVRIELNKFAGGMQPLRLKPQREGDVVEILLGNLTPLARNVDKTRPAEHFALYTKLSSDPKNANEIPIPHIGAFWARKQRRDLEVYTPSVIDSVSEPGQLRTLDHRRQGGYREPGISGGEGGTSRPICTVVEMTPP